MQKALLRLFFALAGMSFAVNAIQFYQAYYGDQFSVRHAGVAYVHVGSSVLLTEVLQTPSAGSSQRMFACGEIIQIGDQLQFSFMGHVAQGNPHVEFVPADVPIGK